VRVTVHDLVGVGVGPFNLSVAALADPTGLDARFFEAEDEFRWHPGMMLPGTRLQTSPLKDLATAVDPTNPYTFLNYLVDQGRFYEHLHAELPAVSRREFEDYLSWAANRIDDIAFASPVEAITHDGDAFTLHVDNRTVRAENVVLGTGPTPKVPECARGELDEHCFHGSKIALRDPDVTDQRVTVVGSGQSGAEVLEALLDEHFGKPARVDWISRRLNFQPLDEVAFTNEYFTPEYVDTFHDVDDERKPDLLNKQKLASDGVSPKTLRSIYRTLYETKAVGGREFPVRLLPGRDVAEFSSTTQARIGAENRMTGEREAYEADVVVFCTGYKTRVPACLDPIRETIESGEHQPYRLDEHFQIAWDGPDELGLYAVNAGRFSHGIAEPQMSLMAWRSARIVNHAAGREVYDTDGSNEILEWTNPDPEQAAARRLAARTDR
jgi:lysine N6-hydroxylase